ncbi:methyltransferase [Fragilaria crotonensis]|nr:methyltransferase [Fragilaria crotonensis]
MANQAAFPFRYLWVMLPYILIGYLYCYVVLLQESLSRVIMANEAKELDFHHSKALRYRPELQRIQNNSITFQDRLRMLETKINAYLGFNSDPFYWAQRATTCIRQSALNEYCPHPEKCDLIMPICLDNFRYNDCIMYDFGIRTQPEFGVILSKPPFNCQVFAFDPSPITKAWYENNTELKDNKIITCFCTVAVVPTKRLRCGNTIGDK